MSGSRAEISTRAVVAVALSIVLWIAFVWLFVNPTVDQSFLIAYFGITAVLAAAVWAILRSAPEGAATNDVVIVSFTLNAAAVAALLSLGPPGFFRNTALNGSLALLATGLTVMLWSSYRTYLARQ